MLMRKQTRVAIYECLFKEGVMVAKKDFHDPKHPDVPTASNLEVIKALQSLKARSYVTEQFSWRHYYWYLTNEGTRYLRDFLHLPPEIVPATLKRQTRTDAPKARAPVSRPEGSKPQEDRQSYRRAPGVGADKKADVGAGTGEVEFAKGAVLFDIEVYAIDGCPITTKSLQTRGIAGRQWKLQSTDAAKPPERGGFGRGRPTQ